jgi:cyclic pyranopterin phosphate synthase
VTRVRLTGGEPLLRRNLASLVEGLARTPGIEDLALTTNGVLLADQAAALQAAGLHRLTVSLDTLDRQRFEQLTRFDALDSVQRGLAAARPLFPILKLDAVIVRSVNDDELLGLLDFARNMGAELRFIEYMDVGGATQWSMASVVSRTEMLARIETVRGRVTALSEQDWAPADRYRTADGQIFGIISSTTQPFCRTCDRSRLTADGLWFRCLYARDGLDLRALVREGASDESIADTLARVWTERDDRGAEVRAGERERTPFVPISRLRKDPHLEMHTRGG